jgi:Zn-dependent protease with chaperone function
VRIAPRVGNTPRSIYLPGGAKCETADNDAVDLLLKRHRGGRWQAFVHKLESRLGYVALALVITVASVWGFVQYAVPAIAGRVAYSLPASIDTALGKGSLSVLDRAFFSPSELSEQQRDELRAVFADMTQRLDDAHTFRLEFRKGAAIGANALALPSGIIVMTDELVRLSRHRNELVAVLAHELGHVIHRHALRRLLQDSATVLIIAAITGDATSITSLSATVPTVLVGTKYSRDFEREADKFALAYLQENDISPRYFADILLRLEQGRSGDRDIPDFLSSHPATRERIKAFQNEG